MPFSQEPKELRLVHQNESCSNQDVTDLAKCLSDHQIKYKSHFKHNRFKNTVVFKFETIELKEEMFIKQDLMSPAISNLGFHGINYIV